MYATVTFFFFVSVIPSGSFASGSLRAAPFNPTTSPEKLPGCKTEKSICSTLIRSGNSVTEVKRHCLCPNSECSMYPGHASLQIAKNIWYGTCHPLHDIPDCTTGQKVVQAAAKDANILEVQCRCIKHSSGQTALWDYEESFLSRPFCDDSDASSRMDGNSLDNANADDNDSARIPLDTLINSTGVSGITILKDFYGRKSENDKNISTLGKKRELRTPALSKQDPFRFVLNKADAVKMHPVIVENQETDSFVQCVGGSKRFYCKNLHKDTLTKQEPKLKDSFYARPFNNTIHKKFPKPLGPDRKLSKGLSGQPQSSNLAVASKFYKQEDDGLLEYSMKKHNIDCKLCKQFDIHKNVQQNNAFLKRTHSKRIALYNTKPISRSIFYKQRSEASREHNNKRSADDISFYQRASDDHSNFYKRRPIQKRAFFKRMQHGNAKFYRRSSHENRALYKRSLDDISAFYKRSPDDNSAFYKRSPDDNSAFYKRSLDDNSAFYKRSPGDNSAFYKRSPGDNSAFYKRAPGDNSAFYKRSPGDNSAFYKRSPGDNSAFYKRSPDENSAFYKRSPDENSAFYKRAPGDNSAFYKRAPGDNSAFYKRSPGDNSAFYKRAPGDNSAFYKRSPGDNSAFYKRSPGENSAFYKRSPDDNSAFYKRSPDDNSAFYKRSLDDNSAFYKRSPDENSAFYKRAPGDNSAFYKRSSGDKSAFYKRSPDDNSAFYKRSPGDNSAFYKRSPDDKSAFYKRSLGDNSAFYKRSPDDNSMFYKRSPGDNSALFNGSPHARSAFYKRPPKDKAAFYKRAFDDKNAFYKRGRNEQSKFYKRKHENNALYKREIIEEAALYKQQVDIDNVIPRLVHYKGTFDNQHHENKESILQELPQS